MNVLRYRATKPVATILALAATVVFSPTPPAQAQGYLRAAPYGYGAYGFVAPYGSYMSYGYEYYLPAEQHRSYDRNSTDFNS